VSGAAIIDLTPTTGDLELESLGAKYGMSGEALGKVTSRNYQG
jgi:hypothetical protein